VSSALLVANWLLVVYACRQVKPARFLVLEHNLEICKGARPLCCSFVALLLVVDWLLVVYAYGQVERARFLEHDLEVWMVARPL